MDSGNKRKPARAGFSLVEVLVACALLMIILVMLLSVTNNTTLIASNASGQIDATRIARESLDLIARDITLAALPWDRGNTNSLQFLKNPAGMGSFANRDGIFWQAPLLRDSTNNTGGNLAIVGYFVLRDLQAANPRESRFQLRRVFVDPKGATNVYSRSTSWLPTLSDFAPSDAATDKNNAQKGWVADGVLGMWVRLLDRGGYEIANSGNYDSRAAKFGPTNGAVNAYPTNVANVTLPSFVEVTLVSISPRDIARISTVPASSNAETFLSQFRTQNPGVKSATSFSRKFPLLLGD